MGQSRRSGGNTILVRATWDSEACVYVAESDDVPGLATEAESLDALIAKLRDMIPELLALNGTEAPSQVPFELLARPSTASSTRR